MRRSVIALALWASSLTALAGDLHADVLEQLGGIESPPTAETLSALGPGVVAELMLLAEDNDITKSKRMRAVHALGWFPSDETRVFLVATLQGADDKMARKAAHALANGWAENAVPELTRALTAEDVQLRNEVAKALGNVPGDAARAALQSRLEAETEPLVKTTIQAALAR